MKEPFAMSYNDVSNLPASVITILIEEMIEYDKYIKSKMKGKQH
jgi:hypothetical protein